MRILLTGSHGFIGSAVKRRIEQGGKHEVFCLDRRDLSPAITWNPEALIHCAWGGVSQAGRNDDEIQIDSLEFTRKACFAADVGGCRRIVSVGSQAEITLPESPYGRRKLQARSLITDVFRGGGRSFAWARLYSVYGPGDAKLNFIPYVIRTLLKGKDVPLTNQNIPWDFLYVDDAADALIRLAESNADGEFEIGFGSSGYTQDVAAMIRDRINPQAKLLFGDKPRRSSEIDGLHCNIDRIYNTTGWLPRVSLDEGLEQTIDYYRKQES